MNVAALLIPPTLDYKQALRLRRFGVAALSYVLATALVAVAWAFGVIPASIVLDAAAAFVAINLALYWTIRSGFNLRFADPSLTRVQIVAAITVQMFVIYHMNDGREVALFGCFIVFLFGIFRLTTRQFIFPTLYTLAAYALVINLLMHFRPEAIHYVPSEWLGWLGLAGFLPCFTIIGQQINALRNRMRETEARQRSLTEMSSDFYWTSDVDHRLTNDGFAADQLSTLPVFRERSQVGQRRWEMPSTSPDEAGWQAHRATLESHLPFRDFELSRRALDGSELHLSISADPVFDDFGDFTGYRGVGTDITARKRSEQAMRTSEQKLRLFADNIPAMTVSWDENLRCSFANKVFAEFFGVVAGKMVGLEARVILGEEMCRELEEHFAQVRQGYPVTYGSTYKLPNGESRHLEIKVLPHIGEHEKFMGCFSVITDITKHKLGEERIHHLAHHDSLTALPNRLLFNDRLQQAITLARRNTRQFALLYLDLNKFKPVNDTLGHSVGDELLKGVAERIRLLVRESDTVARIGGDEFAVILLDINKRANADVVAKKIIAALSAPFQLGPRNLGVKIGSSIGIAVYPADGTGAEELVKVADTAMYGAKQAGSGVLPCAA
jgi:diguanylate cyclase (GGDEF)-like protein/PAS domain S-box-containing protein